MLNTFILSMRGTPYTYYGDELGMTNIDMPTIDEYGGLYRLLVTMGKAKAQGKDLDEFMKQLNYYSRENARTPMQWDSTANAGFTTGIPWKRVNENYKEINVAVENKDPHSVLNHFRKMTRLRLDNLVFVYGDYQILQAEHPDIYAFTRSLDDQKMLVLLNFTNHDSSIDLGEAKDIHEIMINNYDDVTNENGNVTLKPYQAVIFELE